MSAAATLQKLLELKQKSALPIFGDSKSDTIDDLNVIFDRTLSVLLFTLVYILIRVLIGLTNWYSRYMYFKAKRSNSTIVHSMYYTLLYSSGIGNNKSNSKLTEILFYNILIYIQYTNINLPTVPLCIFVILFRSCRYV